MVKETPAPTAKSRRVQDRSVVTRNKLLSAALAAFSEHGFEGTSTRAIADRADVHHPLITYHFDNKLTLWKAAVDAAFQGIVEQFEAAITELAAKPTQQQLQALIRVYVQFAADHPQLHRVIMHESAHPNERLDWLGERYLKPLYRFGEQAIRRGQAEGVVVPGDPALIYNLLRMGGSALFAASHEIRQTTGLDVCQPATIDELVNMLSAAFMFRRNPSND